MRLLSLNAETLLNEKVKSISASHDSWRCIFIKFSSQGALGATIATNMIRDLLGDDEGFIYLCNDGDLFVMFQGQTEPVLNRLGGHIKDLELGAEAAQNKDNQYTVFDLSKHWEGFSRLAASKLVTQSKAVESAKPVPDVNFPEPNMNIFKSAVKKRADRKRLTVLLVEDDPFTRRLVSGTLKAEFDIIEAGSGIAAMKTYESCAPDAVFLDIGLPDVNGHTLLNKFLALDKQAFIVMLSANSLKENILGALEKGAQGFVAKPFAKDKLMNYLRICETSRRTKPIYTGAN